MKKLNILVACEESQAVTRELRLLGHNAYSCDLLPCSGGHPEWHFNLDVFLVVLYILTNMFVYDTFIRRCTQNRIYWHYLVAFIKYFLKTSKTTH